MIKQERIRVPCRRNRVASAAKNEGNVDTRLTVASDRSVEGEGANGYGNLFPV
jgi:hypothetical protein